MNNILNPRTAVGNLVLINVIAFLAMMAFPKFDGEILKAFALHFPLSPDFEFWQPITYMFLHGGFSHLFFNMFALWMFGRQLEEELGLKRFVIYYFATGVGAAIIQIIVNYVAIMSGDAQTAMAAAHGITIGASGAVFGILLAFGVMHPNDRIMLLIPPIPIKAKWFVIIYGALELLQGVRSTDNVAHFAHLGGMLFGLGLLMLWKKQRKIFF